MFTIGDFARLGRVSIRMLRHYDETGLLTPARVDEDSGYRYYAQDQLLRLNRLVALKDLGFKLEQVRQILDDEVGLEELQGMLRLRRAELADQIEADARRLARVEARLRSIEEEGRMTTQEVTVKEIEPVHVAELRGRAGGWDPEDIGPEIKGLFERLGRDLHAAGVTPVGNPLARYEERADEGIDVFAALPVAEDTDGLDTTVWPAVRAATLLHHGSMDGCVPSYEALALWIEDHGLRGVGLSREVTLACPADEAGWLTELQIVVEG